MRPKLSKYQIRIRTTVADYFSDIKSGGKDYFNVVYVLALYPYGIMYVGKTSRKLSKRLTEHWGIRQPSQDRALMDIDKLLRQLGPMEIVETRLDILVAPKGEKCWLESIEAALIKRFSPKFNIHGRALQCCQQ